MLITLTKILRKYTIPVKSTIIAFGLPWAIFKPFYLRFYTLIIAKNSVLLKST